MTSHSSLHTGPKASRLMANLAIAGSLLALVALGACGKKDDSQTVGQKVDSAIAKTEQAASEAKEKASASMAKVEDTMKVDAQKAEDSSKKAVEKAADKISGTAQDIAITTSISAALVKDPDLSAIKINVDTKDGAVTLNGPAPTAAARDKATTLAKAVKGVVSVDNKLVIKGG
jgi:hyperosmotically inducible protein